MRGFNAALRPKLCHFGSIGSFVGNMASSLVMLLFLVKTKCRRKWWWTTQLTLTLAVVVLLSGGGTCEELAAEGLDTPLDCQSGCGGHGRCANGTCLCERGWHGAQCDFCGGRVSLNSPAGFITDGPNNYSVDLQCTWLITSSQPNAKIRFKLLHFATECCWDHLYVFDGDSAYAPLIAAYSGLMQTESPSPAVVPELVTTSGTAYLHFFSDAAYNMSGFNISYSVEVEICPSNCSGNGVCIDGACTCGGHWRGVDCSLPICPNNCGNGKCVPEAHHCACDEGYAGDDCSSLRRNGYWEIVRAQSEESSILGRASHAAVVYNDGMWVFGGERFVKEKYCDIWRFDFRSNAWYFPPPPTSGRVSPKRRYGHSAIVHEKYAYIYGGMVNDETVKSELWRFDFEDNVWMLLSEDEAVACLGHTATKVDMEMIVIFGHSPIYGYLNYVQHFNLETNKWSQVHTKGSQVKGGFGHSSVYDSHSKRIYVHGGFHSESSSSYDLADTLYIYDPANHQWEEKKSGLSKRYLHSAAIISGLMLVYGGNMHNDTITNHGSKCQSLHFLAYDITCDVWFELKSPKGPRGSFERYGHTAVVHNEDLYIFGGFNGEMLNSTVKFTPGYCEDRPHDSCIYGGPGIKCLWDRDTNKCLSMSSELSPTKHYQTCATNSGGEILNCDDYGTCTSCVQAAPSCIWCNGACTSKNCSRKQYETRNDVGYVKTSHLVHFQGINDTKECEPNLAIVCSNLHSCQACNRETDCTWNKDSQCVTENKNIISHSGIPCQPHCSQYKTCENCTQGQCLWCSTGEGRCVESNAYAPAFSYGQCMEWTTLHGKCPPAKCSDVNSCEKCLQMKNCGWCDDGSKTGLGKCMEGSNSSPVRVIEGEVVETADKCKTGWYFKTCPQCQCNGHSTCRLQVDECDQPCHNNTVGKNCEHCAEEYFGNPMNGGNCSLCSCNGHGTLCVPNSGKCYCTTKGITGHNCERCDESNMYAGNPADNGTCFYKLAIDFQFTFNLSKPEDHYYTQINFMSTPPKPDMDTDFAMTCTVDASINVTVKSGNASKPEHTLLTNQSCISFKYKFSHNEYPFGTDDNTTFYVYVYDFQTPVMIQIAFSQYPKLDLLQFFITFSSCFLTLLIVAAILWKIKQKYDLYRRRQRLFVEMEQMASRPCAAVHLQVTHTNPDDVISPQEAPNRNFLNKKKRKELPSPIALEPCFGNKAAVLSLIVQLPTGDETYTPPGQTGIAIASTLVTLGNPRKTSLEAQKGDGKGGKMRKNFHHQHPDTCI